MAEKISASRLKTIRVVRTGRDHFDVTLFISELQLTGIVNGENWEAIVDAAQLYSLMSFIDGLMLNKTTVVPGKPPRGQTKFVLTYQDGHFITLGMNLNEAGLEYYEMEPSEYQDIMELWSSL
tara:strand:+ start:3564 stop:3932 length:369 start_codon:yes stop_codon:yes gene_type:complete